MLNPINSVISTENDKKEEENIVCSIEKGVNASESESTNETAKKERSSVNAVQNGRDIEWMIEKQNAGDQIQCIIKTDSRVTDETVTNCVCDSFI